MNDNVIWEALRRESDLVREHLGFGATTIGRARFESPGLYAQAFFALSIGFERAAKLALTLNAAASESGRFLRSSDLRDYGHRLIDLFDAVEQAAIARQLDGGRPRTDAHDAILRVLSDFASNVNRYYNLEILDQGSSGGRDPIMSWYEDVVRPILRMHDTEQRRAQTERAVEAIAVPGSMAVSVIATSETGEMISGLPDLLRRSGEANAVEPWQRMYVLQLARYATSVISQLAELLQHTRPDIPFLHEFFDCFQLDDEDFRRLKVWPPRN